MPKSKKAISKSKKAILDSDFETAMAESIKARTLGAVTHAEIMNDIAEETDKRRIELQHLKVYELRNIIEGYRESGHDLEVRGITLKSDIIEKILDFEKSIDPSTSMPISRNGGKSKRRRKRTRKRRRKHTRKRR